jgi:hypothetical protein
MYILGAGKTKSGQAGRPRRYAGQKPEKKTCTGYLGPYCIQMRRNCPFQMPFFVMKSALFVQANVDVNTILTSKVPFL